MRFNFIFPNLYTPISFSPAIQILSAVLKNAGHKVFLTHIHKDILPDDDENILNDIKKNNPDIIAFTSTSFEYERSNEIAGVIKKSIDTPIILGGVHATISPEDFEKSNFDAFIVGEGEKTILDIAEGRVEPKGIIKGSTIKDLDLLPFFDWDLFASKKIIDSKGGWLDISLSRGCPFNCAFCANAFLMKIKNTPKIRRRSPKKAIEELSYLKNKFKIKVFSFADDEFVMDKIWLSKFLDLYKKYINLKFKIEARADTVNEDVIKLLKESNCIEIQFGVESGSEKIRKFLFKRESNEVLRRAFTLCDKYNINTYAYVMIGIPTETKDDIEDTMRFLAEIKPKLIRPTFLCPVKGTKIYEYCLNRNIIKHLINVWNYESPLKLEIDNLVLMDYWRRFPDHINKYMDTRKQYYKFKEELGEKTFRFNRLELVTI